MHKKSNNKLAQLVTALGDGEFHDGNALGATLNMTRSAVWKMIKKLERYGIEINSVKGRGYALCEPLVLLDEHHIQKQLAEKNITLSVFENVDSTSTYLQNLRRVKGVHVCLAEQQTGGKARLSREWYSPFGKNIYLSCLYPLHKDISELAGLSLVVSLAIVRALQQFGVTQDVHVKWPNDIVSEGKKISGTLIEVQAESHGVSHAVIGIGLNVNMLIDEQRHIAQAWTSMRRATGKYHDRNDVAVALIRELLNYLRRFDEKGFAGFIDEWMAAEMMTGKQISVKTVRETVTGEVTGINAQGHLLMKLASGETRAFSSGDTTIVKK